MSSRAQIVISARSRTGMQALIFLAAVVALFGVARAPERIWPNLLLNGFYIVSLAVSALFFLATQRLTGARWSAGLRRVPEAFMLLMPAAAGLMLILFFGRHTLYFWSRPDALANVPFTAGRVRYLQVSSMAVRVTISMFLWVIFAWLFRRASLAQDQNPSRSLILHQRLNRYSAVFIPVFAVTFSLSAFDWLLSLDSQWFSSMFAIYVFAGTFVQGIAAITLATILLEERGLLASSVSQDQLHDLGKLLFAFSTFWAYIWTCQYLLIWYGNIPDEVTPYLRWTSGPWSYLFALNLVVNWAVPFVVLLPVRAKRAPRVLKAISTLLLFGHWLDLYLLIMPPLWSTPRIGLFEIVMAAGYFALIYLLFVRNLSQAPLQPAHEPILAAEGRVLVRQSIHLSSRSSGAE